MTRLAQRSDGNTYFVEHSSDLPRIFSDELGDVLSVVARRVVIEIEFPAGVRPLNFVGRDGVVRGQRAELTLNQLYGGHLAPSSAREVYGLYKAMMQAAVDYDRLPKTPCRLIKQQNTFAFYTSRAGMIDALDYRGNSFNVTFPGCNHPKHQVVP